MDWIKQRIGDFLGLPKPRFFRLLLFLISLGGPIYFVRLLPWVTHKLGVLEIKWVYASLVVALFSAIIIWAESQKNQSDPIDSIDDFVRILIDKVEAIAILLAATLFILEASDRKGEKHIEAWQIIDNATGIQTSYARNKAIEELNNDGVPLDRLDLSRAHLYGIELKGAYLHSSNFKEANLSEANLSRANLNKVNLNSADLSEANLSGADLSKANLSGVNLEGVDLSDANISQVDLSNVYLGDTNLSGADLSKANLSGANLSAFFPNDLKEINFATANLSGANLERVQLNGANLKKADLTQANFKGVNLSGADLSGADLSGADLRNSVGIGKSTTNLENTYLTTITWDSNTKWPAKEEVAKAINIPDRLKQQLNITEPTKEEVLYLGYSK